jgi:dihydropteroate synthase
MSVLDSNIHTLTWPNGEMTLHRCRIMGIVNVTPDSFFDGGQYQQTQDAVEHAWQLMEEGADLIDIGGQSTRPGAPDLSLDEEKARVWPVLQALASEKFPLPISLDTQKPMLADQALDKGWVHIINDVGGLRLPDMVEVCKNFKVPVIAMHMVQTPETMQQAYAYQDVTQDIYTFFERLLEAHDMAPQIIIDPGLGFGKSVAHNLQLVAQLETFRTLQVPILLGASRKSFIGKTLNLEPQDRLEGSLAVATMAVTQGCHLLRVHDVQATKRTIQMTEAILKHRTS